MKIPKAKIKTYKEVAIGIKMPKSARAVAIFSLPLLVTKGNTHFKHALEWNYFVGVILFYFLTRLFWKRTT